MKTVKYLPPMAVIIAAVLWSFDGFLRQKLPTAPFGSFSALISFSFMVILLEHAVGGVIFLPILLRGWRQIKVLRQRSWISIAWVASFGGILGTVCYTAALFHMHYIELSVVVLLQKFQPLFAIALAALILREPLTKRFLLLAALALVGGYLLTFGVKPMAEWNDKSLIAALLALLAAFSWGSSTVLGKHALKQLSFPTMTALRLWLTTLVALTIFLATPSRPSILSLQTNQWLIILIIALSTGSVALFIYYYGLKQIPASHATLYELSWPLSAVIIDWSRGKILEPVQIVGALLLITAFILLTRNSRDN
ncbi:MAG: EamA family transporter [Candidatus Neomarinimicrobiota bacterium]